MMTPYIVAAFALFFLPAILAAPAAELIVRPNVGAVFVKEREINVSPMVWHHTLALPYLMDFSLLYPSVKCLANDDRMHKNESICNIILDMEENFFDLTSQLILEITTAQKANDGHQAALVGSSMHQARMVQHPW